MSEILKNLNKQQLHAVKTYKGAFLISAGAGSGKTTTLTKRIAYLVTKHNVNSKNILAVTFTNKAAQEMKVKVNSLLDLNFSEQPSIGTFHSICAKILREDIDKFNNNYDSNFTILDTNDQLSIIKTILKDMNLQKVYSANKILEILSKEKNKLSNPEELLKSSTNHDNITIYEIYKKYQDYLKHNNYLDFDDLIFLTIKLFNKKEILEKYQERFKFISIDEYQDTNHAQYTFIKLLAKKYNNIFAVGDDWQSIYRWRGANITNILNFQKDFKNATIIKLEQNYRSTQNILDTAYSIIKHNTTRSNKKIWTNAGDGEKSIIFEAFDEHDEAEFVTNKIKELVKTDNLRYKDFAVLYRTNVQSRPIEETFLKNNINYKIIGGIKFYNRKEIKDIISYLKLILNPKDIIALTRAISSPRIGIGQKTLDKWINSSKILNANPIDFILNKNAETYLNSSKYKTINKFCTTIDKFKKQKNILTLTELIEGIYKESGLIDYFLDGTEEGENRHKNIEELLSVASKYNNTENSLELFIEEVSLASDSLAQKTSDSVQLMTLHSAKGLEFPVVFIIGIEEGIIPHIRSFGEHIEIEEERRLMYVGITRAKSKVFLTYAKQRLIFGDTVFNEKSRFLEDIPENLIKFITNDIGDSELIYEPINNTDKFTKFTIGQKVEHNYFGIGKIINSTYDTVTVSFENIGTKVLSKKYAQLKNCG